MTQAVKHFARGGDAGGGTYNPEGDTFDFTDNPDGTDSSAGMEDWLNWGTEDYTQPEDDYTSDGLYSDPETTTIGGQIYTRQPDGSWADEDGWSYTDDEIQGAVSSPETDNTPGGDNPADTEDFGNEAEPEGNGNDALVNPNVTGGATKPGERNSRNPTAPTGIDALLGKFKKTDGAWDLAKLAAAGLTAAGATKILADAAAGKKPADSSSYAGKPDMGVPFNREKLQQDPNRRPGSGGAFLGAGSFGPKAGIAAIPATPASEPVAVRQVEETPDAGNTGGGIAAIVGGGGDVPHPDASTGPSMHHMGEVMQPKDARILDDGTVVGREDSRFNTGGIAQAFAKGGPTKPRYLRGETDGMADQVKARIDGGQEARLAHGEFVIPADVVGHLGNGNSDAGAKKLYQMMDKIRMARTGNPKQGKQINPDKFLPGAGKRKMASGGITDVVPRFAEGGTTTTGVNNWAGQYATDVLSQGNAVGNAMITDPSSFVYQGPRAAGTNAIQQKAMDAAGSMSIVNPNAGIAGGMMKDAATKLGNMPAYGAANVSSGYSTGPAYDPTKFNTTDFSQEAAQKYMNPYLKESLDPQLAEARRQADITRMTNAGRLVGSGAFGGGRQAIMEAEGDRNLGTNLANITGQGYNTAFTNAMSQFNADGSRRLQADQASEQSKQFGHSSGMTDRSNAANFGLQAAGINERSREAGARMGLDALTASANTAGQYGNFLNAADQNSRANLNTITGIGNDQYGRDQAGLTADMNQFNEEAALPGQAIKFKQGLLQGMPIANTTSTTADPSTLQQLMGLGLTAAQIASLLGDNP